MRRREFIALVGGAAVWPLAARAQQGERVRRVAILSGFRDADRRSHVAGFRQALREAGWSEGRNVRIDYLSAEGDSARIRAFAAELVGTPPDAVLAMATPALVALREVSRTIPIVFVNVSDPVDGGFVASMARPGGNVTGFTSFEYSLGSKWLETLKEASPGLARVMVMLSEQNYTSRGLLRAIEAAAPSLAVRVSTAGIRSPADIEPAFAEFVREPDGGLIVLPDPATTVPRAKIIALARAHRLPSIQTFRYFAEEGGLMSYGTDDLDLYRRAAGYVDRVLRGADPGELPVQNPTKYQLVINLKTAKALGLEVPATLLARADEVIE
jgi:putative ABC transport system substrate-binding protein